MKNTSVVSSRIRLARNFSEYPFIPKITADQKAKLTKTIHDKVKDDNKYRLSYLSMKEVSPIQAGSMVEEHLISPEFANKRDGKALLLNEDKTVSAMLCEEDHLRLQVFGKGECLHELLDKALEIDDYFDSMLPYAFSDEFGYLTSCPTNLGTGLRASLMLHLPAITEGNFVGEIVKATEPLGLTARGMYGEGSNASGCLYQMSNKMTMGMTEAEIVDVMLKAVEKIISVEHELTEKYSKKAQITDRIRRAEGIARYAGLMSSREWLSVYSDIRWGAEMNINSIETTELDKLFLSLQPYTLMLFETDATNAESRDAKRAEILRKGIS